MPDVDLDELYWELGMAERRVRELKARIKAAEDAWHAKVDAWLQAREAAEKKGTPS